MESIDLIEEEARDIRQKTISGISWSITAQIVRQIIQFIIIVILARILSPEEFGLIGMITVFTGFALMFSTLGFSGALIQKEKVEERHYSSIFWLNLIIGLILTAVIIGISPFISLFYDEPGLTPLTMLIGICFIINSLGLIHKTIIYREMKFKILAFIEIVTMITGGITAIVLAVLGYGVWSLVWQAIISSIMRVLLTWFKSNWRPQLIFDKKAIKDLLGFGSNVLGFMVANYWIRNTDNLLVGKFLGSNSLGVYSRAYSLMLLPFRQINLVISRVMFPALSRIQHDKERTKCIYLRSISLIALIIFPMMIGLLLIADHFILAIYGEKRAGVIPVLQILCIVGMVQAITSTVEWIYKSQGRADWMFRWRIVSGVIVIGSIGLGIWIGSLKAVALCYAITSVIILIYQEFTIPGKLTNMTFGNVIRSVSGIFLSSLLMGFSLLGLSLSLPEEWPHWLYILVQIPFGILIYGGIIHLFKLNALSELKKLVIEQIQLKFSQAFKL